MRKQTNRLVPLTHEELIQTQLTITRKILRLRREIDGGTLQRDRASNELDTLCSIAEKCANSEMQYRKYN